MRTLQETIKGRTIEEASDGNMNVIVLDTGSASGSYAEMDALFSNFESKWNVTYFVYGDFQGLKKIGNRFTDQYFKGGQFPDLGKLQSLIAAKFAGEMTLIVTI